MTATTALYLDTSQRVNQFHRSLKQSPTYKTSLACSAGGIARHDSNHSPVPGHLKVSQTVTQKSQTKFNIQNQLDLFCRGHLPGMTATTTLYPPHNVPLSGTEVSNKVHHNKTSLTCCAGSAARHDSNHSSVSGPPAHLPGASGSRHCSSDSTHTCHPELH